MGLLIDKQSVSDRGWIEIQEKNYVFLEHWSMKFYANTFQTYFMYKWLFHSHSLQQHILPAHKTNYHYVFCAQKWLPSTMWQKVKVFVFFMDKKSIAVL